MDRAVDGRSPFGVLLKRYRLAAGLTHEALAERSALSVRTISDLERGVSRAPRLRSLNLLCDALVLTSENRAEFELAARADLAAASSANLPSQLSSFIGREHELAEVQALLSRDDIRLITLTGPGGTGKTRLAIRVAEECAPAFKDGTFFVSLAPIVEAADVISAIGRGLGIESVSGFPLDALVIDFLRRREALLVLDNFEHVLSAVPLIATLLGACPAVKVLATSRSSLRLDGEQEFSVPPLPVPDLRTVSRGSRDDEYAAVVLFTERARQVQPYFELNDSNADDVAAICARVDGLPLAIELAAARGRILTPHALLVALAVPAGPLDVLTGGRRDLPDRHRTLRATFAWSYELLDAVEQYLLRQLSVFSGGCTISTASAVIPRPSSCQSPNWALEGLDSLVDKSLLRREDGPDEEPRFWMLQVIREFVLEELALHGETEAARERHARHFLAMIESNGPVLLPAVNMDDVPSYTAIADSDRHPLKLAAEQDNLRAALHWLVECG